MENFEEKWSLNSEKRQRINLSTRAYLTMMQDMDCFNIGINKSGFINRILLEFAEDSQAAQLDDPPIAEEKKEAFNVRIDKNVEDLIYNKMKPLMSLKYKSSGAFIKAVIEEYSALPFYERENIFFNEKRVKIENCIRNQLMFKTLASDGKTYDIKPYKIVIDRITGYSYLISYSKPHLSSTKYFIPASWRLSRLNDNIRGLAISSGSGKITYQEKRNLDRLLETRSPAFFIEDNKETVVRLTDEGIRKYKSIYHLRPQFTKVEHGNIYHFDCPLFQAKSYFIRLGADAEILEPVELREYFKDLYAKAYQIYK